MNIFSYIIFFTCFFGFSQQIQKKSIQTNLNRVEINTAGLDELTIYNSNSPSIEISLQGISSDNIVTKEATSLLHIQFNKRKIEDKSVFRKYITERVDSATATIKLPKNKEIIIMGVNVDVISKNYNGNLTIYVEKGYINLNEVQQNATIKLLAGNVFASLVSSNFAISSNKGKILVNNKQYLKTYKKVTENATKTFSVTSDTASITLKEYSY